ncbi:preprotein translocase subunit SecG, partial [Gammaproteobacteria bacterium]|nr:preprotein translocase subunit SecG [Gammaproteobacteria bacterium]
MITNIILAIILIVLVLLQQGKGSDLGSAFGGGSSNSLFGA